MSIIADTNIVKFPKYTPDYARDEFKRLMDIYKEGEWFYILKKWSNDSRMKFVYESLEHSNRERGYFILAMLDSYTTDLDEFKQTNDRVIELDDDIAKAFKNIRLLIQERIELHGDAPAHYDDFQDLIAKVNIWERHDAFMPNMVRQAIATRQTKSPTGGISKARHARAFIVNLSDNGFDVSKIKNAIENALNIIVDDDNCSFSINDIENCIKDLRKKGVIKKKSDTEDSDTEELPPIQYVYTIDDESLQAAKIRQGLEHVPDDELHVIRYRVIQSDYDDHVEITTFGD